jgi:hypothetical protein
LLAWLGPLCAISVEASLADLQHYQGAYEEHSFYVEQEDQSYKTYMIQPMVKNPQKRTTSNSNETSAKKLRER